MTEPHTAAARVPVIRFKQWLEQWDTFPYGDAAPRRKPDQFMLMFAMPAAQLRQLCDVYRRSHDHGGPEGIQRARDEARTARIREYVKFGYPYGDLKEPQRTTDMLGLRKPGWLPTAIVVNILRPDDERRGRKLADRHAVALTEQDGNFFLQIPDQADLDEETSLAPFEVIDGQHRLWAFDPATGDQEIPDDFSFPVVAFVGLDIAWQAYLFWSINVSPKRINPSHAFDLYPLLRGEDWLDRVGELTVYREARAQELTSILQSHPASPWVDRINMLGEKGAGTVSQAAWIRALLATLMATGRGTGRRGLFSAPILPADEPLEWSRAQQAAFVIELGRLFMAEVKEGEATHAWIRAFGDAEKALADRRNLLNQDMGIRALLGVANEIFFRKASDWRLDDWRESRVENPETSLDDVTEALDSIQKAHFHGYMVSLANELASADWRSFDGPGLEKEQKDQKRIYRGSGGYVALRNDTLETLAQSEGPIAVIASVVLGELE